VAVDYAKIKPTVDSVHPNRKVIDDEEDYSVKYLVTNKNDALCPHQLDGLVLLAVIPTEHCPYDRSIARSSYG